MGSSEYDHGKFSETDMSVGTCWRIHTRVGKLISRILNFVDLLEFKKILRNRKNGYGPGYAILNCTFNILALGAQAFQCILLNFVLIGRRLSM